MKHLVIPFILLAALASWAANPHLAVVARKNVAAGGGCATSQDAELAANAYSVDQSANAKTWMATKFTAGGSYTVCAVDLYLSKTLTPTDDLYCYIYSHDGAEDDPDALVGTGSNVVAPGVVTGSEAAVQFTGMSAALTSGTTYWVVFKDGFLDSSNYITIHGTDGAVERICQDADGAGTWGVTATGKTLKYQLYSE